MKKNTIKIKKFFYSFMKEKVWLEKKALEGYKLCNITMGYIYEFERIKPVRLVYEIDRFHLSSQPTLSDIQKKEQLFDMAEETGWEILTFDETMTYYLCKPYDEHAGNELYNDEESRTARAERFRSVYTEQGHSLIGYALTINVLAFLLFAMEGFRADAAFIKFYLSFNIVYSTFVFIWQYICRKIGNDIYADLCLSAEEWQKKFDYSRDNVKKAKKIFVRSSALVKYLNQQAADGWYLSGVKLFSYTFTKGNPAVSTPLYYIVDNKSSVSRRLQENGLSLEKNHKDVTSQSFQWMEQSIKTAQKAGLQYICSFNKQYTIYAATDLSNAQNFQKKGIFVGWLSYGYIWFFLACGIVGGICGLVAGIIS